ncbi:hypothetical protein [Chryseobacterium sp. CT-SW4]|uniref:hypothetical protein n=1 Tax=Chryseobacterium sp. SW-1 TaxID=3157343 RepID=UPI003B022B1A
MKYRNLENPTYCDHDAMIIYDIEFDEVDPSDREDLINLGFFWSEEECWMSYRFGN